MAEIYNNNAKLKANILAQNFGEMESLLSSINTNRNQMDSIKDEMYNYFHQSLDREDVWDPGTSDTMNTVFQQEWNVLSKCVNHVNHLYNVIKQIYSNNKELHAKWTSIAYANPKNTGVGTSADDINTRYDEIAKQQESFENSSNNYWEKFH